MTSHDACLIFRVTRWESAHWDAESCGMVAFELGSKAVLGLGPPDPVFIERGQKNFTRFAAVLNSLVIGKRWLIGDQLTIADFSVGGFVPTARLLKLPIGDFPAILSWYDRLAALPGWREALSANDAAMAAWQESAPKS